MLITRVSPFILSPTHQMQKSSSCRWQGLSGQISHRNAIGQFVPITSGTDTIRLVLSELVRDLGVGQMMHQSGAAFNLIIQGGCHELGSSQRKLEAA
jgi:hypothetical protein